ncbi:MAG TPA: carbonic anhydrase [Vicinamibacterales bacterium]|jgi:carbonic anhydrase|nr:carbonic anhydrase [Vicinamibacterales bacterium]
MDNLRRLFDNNRALVEQVTRDDPDFFTKRAGKQEPHFLFIGCADSRVPLETLTGALPGEMFVHRNIANQVLTGDLNVLSVLQYAVEVLDVEHVIVCGHYQCGGVKAAMGDDSYGLVDHWLAGIRDQVRRHQSELEAYPTEAQRFSRVVELNVLRQVYNLSRTPIVQSAWRRGRRPMLHGIVYDLHDGLLKQLVLQVDGQDKVRALLEADRRGVGV